MDWGTFWCDSIGCCFTLLGLKGFGIDGKKCLLREIDGT